MTKGFAFDIDGVLIRGGKVLAGAQKALLSLNAQRVPWILLTNGGGYPEVERTSYLSKILGVPISPKQFLQSHTPFRDFVGRNDRILVVGGKGDSCRKVAESYGFKDVVIPGDICRSFPDVTPYPSFSTHMEGARPLADPKKPFDAIFVFHDSRDATTDTQIISDLLVSENGVLGTRRGNLSFSAASPDPSIPIYFSNADLQWVADYCQPRFGQGALIAMVQALFKGLTCQELHPTVIGKPTKLTYDYASRLLNKHSLELTGKELDPTDIYMVGDNQASDIMGANNYGWKSVLVRTGVYQSDDRLYTKPTYIENNVLSAVEKVLADPRSSD